MFFPTIWQVWNQDKQDMHGGPFCVRSMRAIIGNKPASVRLTISPNTKKFHSSFTSDAHNLTEGNISLIVLVCRPYFCGRCLLSGWMTVWTWWPLALMMDVSCWSEAMSREERVVRRRPHISLLQRLQSLVCVIYLKSGTLSSAYCVLSLITCDFYIFVKRRIWRMLNREIGGKNHSFIFQPNSPVHRYFKMFAVCDETLTCICYCGILLYRNRVPGYESPVRCHHIVGAFGVTSIE